MTVNFGKVSSDYAKYRDHLPPILFEQLTDRGVRFEGAEVVELGSGTGIFCRDLAERGAEVIGIEPSQPLINEAVEYDRKNSVNSIGYVNGKAEDVVLQGRYPIVTAVRAWHWFNRLQVIRNVKKYLEIQGYLIIINSIFLPDSIVARTTFEVLRSNNIKLKPAGSNAEVKERRNGFPANWFDEWEGHSLQLVHEWQQDYELQFTHEEWCGKIRSVSWMTNADEHTRRKVTDELKERLKEREEILRVPHRYSVVILKNT